MFSPFTVAPFTAVQLVAPVTSAVVLSRTYPVAAAGQLIVKLLPLRATVMLGDVPPPPGFGPAAKEAAT